MHTQHYENANFLRGLAESLPQEIHKPEHLNLLQRLADEELEQARYDEWVRNKVTAARADTRPGMSTSQLRQLLQTRYEALHNAV